MVESFEDSLLFILSSRAESGTHSESLSEEKKKDKAFLSSGVLLMECDLSLTSPL